MLEAARGARPAGTLCVPVRSIALLDSCPIRRHLADRSVFSDLTEDALREAKRARNALTRWGDASRERHHVGCDETERELVTRSQVRTKEQLATANLIEGGGMSRLRPLALYPERSFPGTMNEGCLCKAVSRMFGLRCR